MSPENESNGRVKEPALTSIQAAAWLDQARTSTVIPEYLHLGETHDSEQAIIDWLTSELMRRHEFVKLPPATKHCQWTPAHPIPPRVLG